LFFVLFLEFVKLGPIERRFICNTLGFFNYATNLLCHQIPAAPQSLPKLNASTEEAEEPDEKDISSNSPFAELYGVRDKDKPETVVSLSVKSHLSEVDMVYLLESLTVIIQNAKLSQLEAPPPSEPSPASSKKGKKNTPSQAAEPVAESSQSSAAESSNEVTISPDMLTRVIETVLPNMMQYDVGQYAVKQFVLRLATANKNVIAMLSPMFDNFLNRGTSLSARKNYADVVLSILNVRDGASAKRLSDYMNHHLDFIAIQVSKAKRKGPMLQEPLECLALIVNGGGKEVKDEYRKAAREIFTDVLLETGDFYASYR